MSRSDALGNEVKKRILLGNYILSGENYDNAVILHFAGHKPWTKWFTHSYLKPLWFEYHKEASSKYNI